MKRTGLHIVPPRARNSVESHPVQSSMLAWIEIQDYKFPGGWSSSTNSPTNSRAKQACEQLESGEILYFSRPPFEFSDADREFLVAQRRADSAVHKNVSYRPSEDAVRGFEGSPQVLQQLQQVLRNYSRHVVGFVREFLSPYARGYTLDYASFRPIEEDGRSLPLHKRNDLLHVDAFPSRPTHGGRILRVFTNIHPTKPRVWNVGETFPVLAGKLANDAGLQRFAAQGGTSALGRMIHALGGPVPNRSAYDRFMLHFHDYLKENAQYQSECPKTRIEFPPMATWLVYTDGIPHAVMSGQHALEQTFIISRAALVAPKVSPIGVLESLSGKQLASASA